MRTELEELLGVTQQIISVYWIYKLLEAEICIKKAFLTTELLSEKHQRKGFLYLMVTGDEKWIYYDIAKKKEYYAKPGEPVPLSSISSTTNTFGPLIVRKTVSSNRKVWLRLSTRSSNGQKLPGKAEIGDLTLHIICSKPCSFGLLVFLSNAKRFGDLLKKNKEWLNDRIEVRVDLFFGVDIRKLPETNQLRQLLATGFQSKTQGRQSRERCWKPFAVSIRLYL